ncbi:MAG: ankyrin repeat domain-containing protein [Rhodospirillaceae bacterium]|nr:ankyrin repeat domain-containing protein [Rhodospirillaceae bacterium]
MYGIIKKVVLLMLVVSMHAFALNDSEEMEFVGAVNDGDIKIVKRYVETMNVNLEDSYFAWTPFLMSAAKNQMEVMEYLKANGANINYTHPVTRFNALHHAAFNGNKEMVKYLIDAGVEQKNLKGDVSLIRALNEDNKKDMAKYLISLGLKDDGCQEQRCF